MGGSGSGGQNYKGYRLVENTPCLEMKRFKQMGCTELGSNFTVRFGEQCFHFETVLDGLFSVTREGVKKTEFYIGYNSLFHRRHFGKTQYYFVCPGCQKWFNKLYLFRQIFRCRICHRLKYRSQRERGLDRLNSKILKIENRLGSRGKKPKYMKLQTYSKLCKRLTSLYQLHDRLFIYTARKLVIRADRISARRKGRR